MEDLHKTGQREMWAWGRERYQGRGTEAIVSEKLIVPDSGTF